MRNVWIVVASALLAFANFVKSQETSRNLYSSRYDNLDIDTILSSNRLVNNYVDCLLSRKPCPPEGKDLKRILPEALRTKCARCSATQKENALKIITTLYYSYPEQYQSLRERWDPSGEYHRRFEEYLRGIQFNQIGGNTGPSDRPVRNDFDRDQSQILLQTLLLSTTAATPPSPNAIPSGPEQRPQLATSAQLTQAVAPITSTTSTTTTTTTTTTSTTTTTPTTTTTTSASPTTATTSINTSTGSSAAAGETGTTTVLGEDLDAPSPTTTPATDTQPTVGTLSNRFGADDAGTTATARPPVQATTRPPRQTTSRVVTQRTTSRFVESIPAVQLQGQIQVFPAQAPSSSNQAYSANGGQTTPNNVIDNFFIPPGQAPSGNKSPIVGLFSQLGSKLATTADAIAGMLRKTVDVIVTTHLQSHQRALRSF